MIIILGLIILLAAAVAGVAGVLGNSGSTHAVSHFSLLGYHLTGSAGMLFLCGIVVGAAGLLGLILLLAGARRSSRRAVAARRGLKQSRRETATASQERDALIDERDAARADTTGRPSNGTASQDAQLTPAGDRRSRLRDLRRRLGPAQTATQPDLPAGRLAPDVPATSSDPGVTAVSPAPDVAAGTPA
jgi:uncharacterized protein (DUF3084 family)